MTPGAFGVVCLSTEYSLLVCLWLVVKRWSHFRQLSRDFWLICCTMGAHKSSTADRWMSALCAVISSDLPCGTVLIRPLSPPGVLTGSPLPLCCPGADIRALSEGDWEDGPRRAGHVPGEGHPGPVPPGGLSVYRGAAYWGRTGEVADWTQRLNRWGRWLNAGWTGESLTDTEAEQLVSPLTEHRLNSWAHWAIRFDDEVDWWSLFALLLIPRCGGRYY